ncbi:Protein of unknown function [Saccharopolyspora flava]|uniref:DUF4232 domain-containing protein n=1 Tax=Saccharopolyspora flava TaxID=95161 RepID=A0A1I6NX28_9PSEU|nr:Protein of unknown function [Saccharopolyspora flava]
MLRTRGKRLAALLAATAAVTVSCGQQAPQAQQVQQPPATVTVTQPAPQESGTEETSEPASESSTTADSRGESGTACRTEELRARFYPDVAIDLIGDPSQPEGQSHTVLRIANISGRTCTVTGAARVEFTGVNGEELPVDLVENPAGPSASTISLGTRDGAAQDFFWKYKTGDCIDPAKISIYPPENSDPIVLDWNLGVVCGGPQLEHGRLFAN